MSLALRFVTVACSLLAISCGSAELPFDSLMVGEHSITFNCGTTMAGVDSLLGPTETHQRGDAGGSLTWKCYYSVADGDSAVLILESQEMGGGVYATGFQLARPGSLAELERGRSVIAIAPGDIATDRRITLGMTREHIEGLLGPPTVSQADRVEYNYAKDTHGPHGPRAQIEDYTVLSQVIIWYSDGVSIHISGYRMDVS